MEQSFYFINCLHDMHAACYRDEYFRIVFDILLSCYSPDENDIDLADIHSSIADGEEPETLDLRQQPAASLESQPLEYKVEPSCRKRPRNPVDNSQYYHQDELENYRKRHKLNMQHYYDEAYYAAEKKMRNPFLDESLMKPLDTFENYARGSMNPINYTLTAEAINRRIRSTLGLEDDSSANFDRQRSPSNEECCTANQDWLMRRGPYVGNQFTIASSQIDISPSSFAHDDNNNVDKKLFQ
ncbi:uncharacterized protein LOC129769455 [Toxorhynchites rutilus septentrionalis]|uniref:uncharacterized protein LOC129769455 n=1 Tax=Toxorhynchites rutilus septentrionalis TaxID=329112 RepID=UPI002479FD03|nr:uncharacterized protein LOC129769455 [Toxorhynchites rutilus septentrionalis]XP_055627715.1 uncharacterized protein LOC129769455 [Toxorhynchites rutilus septentrionalis]XP_055627716.1 uncharacterized protein LOC129769455 [Toxorhynchites rutilus septentrionalis]